MRSRRHKTNFYRLRGELTDADALRRLCLFVAWAASGVNRAAHASEDSFRADANEGTQRLGHGFFGWHDEETKRSSSLLWRAPQCVHPPALATAGSTAVAGGIVPGGVVRGGVVMDSVEADGVAGVDEDESVRGIWATTEEMARTSAVLLSPPTLAVASANLSLASAWAARTAGAATDGRVTILAPRNGEDVVFEALVEKSMRVAALVEGYPLGESVGYACVFLDGMYKGCSVDEHVEIWIGDPGLDYTWHVLEVRLMNADQRQVAPSVCCQGHRTHAPAQTPTHIPHRLAPSNIPAPPNAHIDTSTHAYVSDLG